MRFNEVKVFMTEKIFYMSFRVTATYSQQTNMRVTFIVTLHGYKNEFRYIMISW